MKSTSAKNDNFECHVTNDKLNNSNHKITLGVSQNGHCYEFLSFKDIKQLKELKKQINKFIKEQKNENIHIF